MTHDEARLHLSNTMEIMSVFDSLHDIALVWQVEATEEMEKT